METLAPWVYGRLLPPIHKQLSVYFLPYVEWYCSLMLPCHHWTCSNSRSSDTCWEQFCCHDVDQWEAGGSKQFPNQCKCSLQSLQMYKYLILMWDFFTWFVEIAAPRQVRLVNSKLKTNSGRLPVLSINAVSMK